MTVKSEKFGFSSIMDVYKAISRHRDGGQGQDDDTLQGVYG